MTDGPRLRGTLDGIPLYRAGQRPEPRDDLETFKISSNENPYPPLPRVLEVIAEAAQESNRYPDPSAADLVSAIALYHGVDGGHVAVGTGAVALCYQVAHCTVDAGDEIIYPWRSFEAYPIVARVAGARAVPVQLDAAGGHDLDAVATAVTDRTRLIFVCSPNNPTGTVVTQQALDEFLARIPRDVLVVLDEAYVEFNRDAAAFDGITTYSGHDNVAVLRTFSKAYGLAGLRVGYAIAPERIIGALQQTACRLASPTSPNRRQSPPWQTGSSCWNGWTRLSPSATGYWRGCGWAVGPSGTVRPTSSGSEQGSAPRSSASPATPLA